MKAKEKILARARGSLYGQLAGDSLGSLVEFKTPEEILRQYPLGVRDMADGGTWHTMAGQPTDDSELALLLARSLIEEGTYVQDAVIERYRWWLDSQPFDCGATVAAGIKGRPNRRSQANGALMRISPLGIFGSGHPQERVALWARLDAALTHPHPVCLQVNDLFARAIAFAVQAGPGPRELYQVVAGWAARLDVDPSLQKVIDLAAEEPPADYLHNQGWVLTAFHHVLRQLAAEAEFEQAVIDTVMQGGDTDTNAAICGALLGAVYGEEAVPERWKETLAACRPAEQGRTRYPRPSVLWPSDVSDVAERLVLTRE